MADVTTCQHCRDVIWGVVYPPCCDACVNTFHGGNVNVRCVTCCPGTGRPRVRDRHPPRASVRLPPPRSKVVYGPKPRGVALDAWGMLTRLVQDKGVDLEVVATEVCTATQWAIVRARYMEEPQPRFEDVARVFQTSPGNVECVAMRALLRLITYVFWREPNKEKV